MNAGDIRKAYFDFFVSKKHVVVPRANLVPQEDASTLFTGSGMQPMIPYLLGENHPQGKRLVNSQVCFRAQDIEEVGDDKHTTSFEMLGNWSLGDYYKSDQIKWIAEFMFDVVGLDPNKIFISCYIGSEKYGIPKDEQAITLWQAEFEKRGIAAKVIEIGSAERGSELGMQGGRIFLYDGNENWWSRNGSEENTLVGDPCGPDSEMFYDFGEQYHDESKWGKPHPASDSPRFFEIGNNVFMGYRRTEDGFEELEHPNIDHGSGLERIAAAKLGSPDIFKIDLFKPIIEKLEKLSRKSYSDSRHSMQVIADHLKGALFLVADGVKPSNKGQGYVLRRITRRAILNAFHLGIEQDFVQEIAPVVANIYKKDFPEILDQETEIVDTLLREEKAFKQTLRKGLKEFERIANVKYVNDKSENPKPGAVMFGGEVFKLYDTYGFPAELTLEEAKKLNISMADDWETVFEHEMSMQRKRSQTATKGKFKGGLAGGDEIHKKYHTATHLMYKALRMVLGDHVVQRGSNITADRLRFDFSHPEKMTDEQKQEVEHIVNQAIKADYPMSWQELPTKQAIEKGALGAFGDKYGDMVKVYRAGHKNEEPFSFEICGGPHVERTGQLAEGNKAFKIKKEESSSAGVRRIKAILT